jgi:endoglucanase
MDDEARDFLDRLLATPSPSGFERDGQAAWTGYVERFADDVRTDAYGTAVASVGDGEPAVAVASHADEIGLTVRHIDDDGFVHPGSIGSVDPSVLAGQRVTVHAADRPVPGVVGQTALHVRDERFPERDVTDHRIDLGAADGDAARALVSVGDPITVGPGGVQHLGGTRFAARGADDRVGGWVVAEALRRATPASTALGVNTVQEEVGKLGAKMAGFDLAADAVIAVDVTFATDHPRGSAKTSDLALGDGPVLARGSINHPDLVSLVRETAAEEGISLQVEATGNLPGTDTEAFAVQGGGVPACYVGLPLRYMHTPREVADLDDLDATADLLAAVLERVADGDLP